MALGPVEIFLIAKMEKKTVTNSFLIARQRNSDDQIRDWLNGFVVNFDGMKQGSGILSCALLS